MAARLEAAGFESLWVSDHIVLPASIESHYPFAADGRATWPSTTPYFDALIALALMAAATERATLGTAVLVLPLRHPVVFAKQAASIDVASGGRLQLGVGAGWLREEFEALNVPFEDRGRRLVEWMEIARDCWTGTPAARSSERYTLPAGVLCLPTSCAADPVPDGRPLPRRAAPRRPARRRAGSPSSRCPSSTPTQLASGDADAMRAAAAEAGRDPDDARVVLRIVDSAGRAEEIAAALPALAAAGVDEIIVDVSTGNGEDAGGSQLHPDAARERARRPGRSFSPERRGGIGAVDRAAPRRAGRSARRPLRLPPRGRRGGRGRRSPRRDRLLVQADLSAAGLRPRRSGARRSRGAGASTSSSSTPRRCRRRRSTAPTSDWDEGWQADAAGERARAGQPDPRGGPALPRAAAAAR